MIDRSLGWSTTWCQRIHGQTLEQEFEFQGYTMRGPIATLFKAGAGGKHHNNIRRDWFRQLGNMKYDHRASKLKYQFSGHLLVI